MKLDKEIKLIENWLKNNNRDLPFFSDFKLKKWDLPMCKALFIDMH